MKQGKEEKKIVKKCSTIHLGEDGLTDFNLTVILMGKVTKYM